VVATIDDAPDIFAGTGPEYSGVRPLVVRPPSVAHTVIASNRASSGALIARTDFLSRLLAHALLPPLAVPSSLPARGAS
jgi:hypothetical protein